MARDAKSVLPGHPTGRFNRPHAKRQAWIASLEQSRVSPRSRSETRRRSSRHWSNSALISNVVLRGAGIEPAMFSDPDNDLPFPTLDRLVQACVKATGCVLFGSRVGARMQPDGGRAHRPRLDARPDSARRAPSPLLHSQDQQHGRGDGARRARPHRVVSSTSSPRPTLSRRPDRRCGDRNDRQHDASALRSGLATETGAPEPRSPTGQDAIRRVLQGSDRIRGANRRSDL